MNQRVFFQTAFIVLAGSLLHFVWEWSGESSLVALVGAVNESTWEHLKLAFWPALILSAIQWPTDRWAPGILPAAATRCILPSVLIVLMFYGYTALLGHHALLADLTIFVIAIAAGEWAGERLRPRVPDPILNPISAVLLLLAVVAFSTFTYYPPDIFLFRDPAL